MTMQPGLCVLGNVALNGCMRANERTSRVVIGCPHIAAEAGVLPLQNVRRRALATGVLFSLVCLSATPSDKPSVRGVRTRRKCADAQASVPCAICGVPRHVSGR